MRIKNASLLLLAFMVFSAPASAFESLVEISRDDLQKRVDKLFPRESDAVIAKIRLRNPQVFLHANKNLVSLKLSYDLLVDNRVIGGGHTNTEGTLVYKQGTGEFYLRNARMTEFESNQIDVDARPLVHQLANDITRALLDEFPLYVLDESDLRQRFLRKRLISVEVVGGKLFAKFEM